MADSSVWTKTTAANEPVGLSMCISEETFEGDQEKHDILLRPDDAILKALM
jgi:hypothetical protein